ncbi:hypothetical protein C8A03DRAFT_35009 [Achaetomium macrosporum]|uniref:Uncharacterized protein n=1 Tax=Achaetomium macrosporum TaxID=79813 RepID=A0AAN7HB69_9PEZI|nr:hypothetical protein C8A03DRAFT_35009 [Achaetomium macrosporum]
MPMLDLPYAVKGMDCSFSGILTRAEELAAQMKGDTGVRRDICLTMAILATGLFGRWRPILRHMQLVS